MSHYNSVFSTFSLDAPFDKLRMWNKKFKKKANAPLLFPKPTHTVANVTFRIIFTLVCQPSLASNTAGAVLRLAITTADKNFKVTRNKALNHQDNLPNITPLTFVHCSLFFWRGLG
jgi:hypothetical protein